MFGKKNTKSLEELDLSKLQSSLELVVDPVYEQSIGSLGFLGKIERKENALLISMNWPSPAWMGRANIETELLRKMDEWIDGKRNFEVHFLVHSTVLPARPDAQARNNAVPGAKNVILFASGKGGVGKSTVATNVAAALAEAGARVGLLDADIYGPSIPTMMGAHVRPEVHGQKLLPVEQHGLLMMSIGFVVDPNEAMVWRGPMLNGALLQFMRDVEWGDLDYLIIDMPPGTGDIQLTIAQNIKVAGAVLVSTPQEVALIDVRRGKAMFDKVEIPTLGVVENMSYFVCDQCDKKHRIFSNGGAKHLAEILEVPLLAEVPLETSTRAAGDNGTPAVLREPESASAKAFKTIAYKIATELAKQAKIQNERPGKSLRIVQ